MQLDSISQQVETLGREIREEFLAKLGTLAVSDEEKRMIEDASAVLATAAIASLGADEATAALWKEKADTALATLANLSVAKQIDAATAMRSAAVEAVARAIKVLTTVVFAA